MTQSTLRFLIAGIFTVGLLASLARGDDKQRVPELLPMPHCDACDKAPDCCTAGTQCCQEGSDCCAKPTAKKTGFIVSEMPKGVDFGKRWSSSNVPEADIKRQIADLMNEYHALYKEHKYPEAELAALKAQELDPDNYVVGTAVSTAHMAKAHREYQNISKEQRGLVFREEIHEAERVGPLRQNVEAAETERDIRKKLAGQITGFDYRDTAVQQILDDLSGWSQINIDPDLPALKDRIADLSKPVTLKLDGGSLSAALSLVLHPAGLTYQVKNDALVITTKEKELAQLERRVFPVSDLIGADSNNLTNFLSMLTENKKESPEATLIQFIQDTVEPQSWSKSGGLARIEYFPLGKAVVVSQTPDNQEKVQKLLNAVRLLQSPRVNEAKCDSCLVIGCDAPANVSEVQVLSKLETRVYTVADLVYREAHSSSGEEVNPDDLIELIVHFIEPRSWQLDESTKDKPGLIVYYQRARGLIVTHTPEVQERVQGLLEALRSLQGQNATKEIGVSNPNIYPKMAPSTREVMTVGVGFNQRCEPACLVAPPMQAPTPQLVTDFAAPMLSNPEPAAQALPFITRDANGATRMGFTYGSFTNEPSPPPPPPVPTFKVPQTVDGEKLTHDATTAMRLMQEGVRTELGTCVAGQACQQPQSCDSPFQAQASPNVNAAFSSTPAQAWDRPKHWTAAGTLQAMTPQCPLLIPANATFGQNCPPVQAEATRDCVKSSGTGFTFFIPRFFPQFGPVEVTMGFGSNGIDSAQTEPNPFNKDYRVSVGDGIRIAVPMLGPVPVGLDFGMAIAKGAQSAQACPVTAILPAPSLTTHPFFAPPAQTAVQFSPAFAPLGFIGRENYSTQAVPTCDVAAVPTSYAPVTPTVPNNRRNERWTIRVHTDGDRPSFSVQSENASMECERLVLKLKQNGSLEFIAGKKSVRVRGKDFEAEAETIECQNNDGKLVLSGKVTLTSAKNDCTVKANKVVWDSGEWHAYGAGCASMK